jgi:REP element-mobilizing transposase RayT
MQWSEMGQIVTITWEWLALQYNHVELDEWVMMPNHIHGIIVIDDGCKSAKCKPLGGLVGAFKTVSTKRINEIRQTPGTKLWQRNYWEHIIRNEVELTKIREYVQNNPAQWELDTLHPCNDDHCRGGSRTAPTPGSERCAA